MKYKTILEALKGLEMIVEDGNLKDCLVYHEAVKSFIVETLDKLRDDCVGEKVKCDYCDGLVNNSECEVYCNTKALNTKRQEIIDIFNKLSK